MSGSASDYLENKLLDHALGTTTFTKPTTVYVGLYTVAPSDAAGGTEVSGGTGPYSRKTITFASAVNGSAANDINVDFTGMPACTIVAVGIFNSPTPATDDLLFWSTLSISRVLTAGDAVRISIGALVVTLN